MASLLKITDVGLAEIVNSENNGLSSILITEIGFGTANYLAESSAINLINEFKRLDAQNGINISDTQVHISVIDEDLSAEYLVSEIGIFSNSGTLIAVYSDETTAFIEKTAGSNLMLSVDIDLSSIEASNISFKTSEIVNPTASEMQKGVSQIATKTEVSKGTDDNKFITAKKLKDFLNIFTIPWGLITSKPIQATRWPSFAEVTDTGVVIRELRFGSNRIFGDRNGSYTTQKGYVMSGYKAAIDEDDGIEYGYKKKLQFRVYGDNRWYSAGGW